MRKRWVAMLAGGLILALFSLKAQAEKISKDDFIKICGQECSFSLYRHKANIKDESRPTDQCLLIKFYAAMLYEADKNKRGAELIFKDICPKALDQRL